MRIQDPAGMARFCIASSASAPASTSKTPIRPYSSSGISECLMPSYTRLRMSCRCSWSTQSP